MVGVDMCCPLARSDGILLVKLIEALSERKYQGKALKPSNQRVQKIDNLNNALSFVWASGVEMKVKPQAENFVDGDVRYSAASLTPSCGSDITCPGRVLCRCTTGRASSHSSLSFLCAKGWCWA